MFAILYSHLALEIDVSDQESYIKKLIREVFNQQDMKLMGKPFIVPVAICFIYLNLVNLIRDI